MLFDADQLREILNCTPDGIEVRNDYGRCYRILSRAEALALDLALFIGIPVTTVQVRTMVRARAGRFELGVWDHPYALRLSNAPSIPAHFPTCPSIS